MIPKIIHYVWIGGEKPAKIEEYINNWKSTMADYEFKEWNLANWDISQYPFAEEALADKKYAYISDIIRLDVIYEYGGIYLDTDVEILKPFDDFLSHRAFFGYMYDNSLSSAIFGAEKGVSIFSNMLNLYQRVPYSELKKGNFPDANNAVFNSYFSKYYPKLTFDNTFIEIDDSIVVYPKEYFEQPTYNSSINYSIHHFSNSWGEDGPAYKKVLKQAIKRILPKVAFAKISAARGKKRYENTTYDLY